MKSVRESFKKPLEYWQTNVGGTINLIKVMQNNNCLNLIFSSSASIYDTTSKLIAEESNLRAKHPYAGTKIAVEKLLNDVYKAKFQLAENALNKANRDLKNIERLFKSNGDL